MDEAIIETFTTHTAKQQAELLGMRYGTVIQRRMRLAREGRISWHDRAYQRPWSEEERQTAIDMLADGASSQRIARRLGRSADAVEIYIARHLDGIRYVRTRNAVRTRNSGEVAALMGWPCQKKVVRLIELGALKGRGRYRYKGAEWLIDDVELVAFLHNRRWWMAWDVAMITDADLRNEAQQARSDAGGAWVRLSDWCKVRGYTQNTGSAWARNGYFETAVQWATHWYAWDSELAAFVPPSERGR